MIQSVPHVVFVERIIWAELTGKKICQPCVAATTGHLCQWNKPKINQGKIVNRIYSISVRRFNTWSAFLYWFWMFISSPEPKAQRWAYRIGRFPSSGVRPSSVNIFKRLLLWSCEVKTFDIWHKASTGEGNQNCCFLFRSDKNSGCHGNFYVP